MTLGHFERCGMNKKTILWAVILLFPGALVWAAARGGSGFSSGSGGGRSNSTASGYTGGGTRSFSGGGWTGGRSSRSGGWSGGNRGGAYTSRSLHYFNHSSLTRGGSMALHHFNHPNAVGSGKTAFTSRSLSQPALPTRNAAGGNFSASQVSSHAMSSSLVTNRMASLSHDGALRNSVTGFNRTENAVGHYYWHNWNGNSYVHYYGGWGRNWYGWCWGGNFYWTLWANGWWWWCDPWNGYWCYWDNGWLWQNPYTDVVYVYQNGDYQPALNAEGGYAQPPDGTANGTVTSQEKPALAPLTEKSFASPDGSKTVKILDNGDAFLYDSGKSKAHAKPQFLAFNVKSVKFTHKGSGPVVIQINHKDGTFDLFNLDGSPTDKKKA